MPILKQPRVVEDARVKMCHVSVFRRMKRGYKDALRPRVSRKEREETLRGARSLPFSKRKPVCCFSRRAERHEELRRTHRGATRREWGV